MKCEGEQLQLVSLPHYNADKRKKIMDRWYREQITREVENWLKNRSNAWNTC